MSVLSELASPLVAPVVALEYDDVSGCCGHPQPSTPVADCQTSRVCPFLFTLAVQYLEIRLCSLLMVVDYKVRLKVYSDCE